MNERDIWAAARNYIDRYGEDAATTAAKWSLELFAGGDADGAAMFKRIVSATYTLQRTAPDGPLH